MLALPLDEASVKVRTGPPKDEPEDYQLDFWAGVVPAALVFGPPEPDPALRPGLAVPDHIAALARPARPRLIAFRSRTHARLRGA